MTTQVTTHEHGATAPLFPLSPAAIRRLRAADNEQPLTSQKAENN